MRGTQSREDSANCMFRFCADSLTFRKARERPALPRMQATIDRAVGVEPLLKSVRIENADRLNRSVYGQGIAPAGPESSFTFAMLICSAPAEVMTRGAVMLCMLAPCFAKQLSGILA